MPEASRGSQIAGPRASAIAVTDPQATQDADVVVVGAGPGGSSVAAFLARQGLDVLLLEKSGFPRDKVCGDGLTPRTVRMLGRLGVDISPSSGWVRNKGLRIYGGRVEPFEMPWPQLTAFPDFGLVCPRSVFDDLLAGVAVQAGARLHTGVRVAAPIVDDRSGRVLGVTDAQGREYRAPIVVACDGVSSRLAEASGRPRLVKRPMGVAVRSYYTSPKGSMDWIESYLELWDGLPGESNLLPGYGWVFGLGDGVANVGLGMLDSSKAFGKTDYRQLMRTWLDNTPEEWGFREANRLEPIRGAALPMAINRKDLYRDGLMLVGDSAGMVNPFNGEGISYAMESAEMAARAIVDAHARGFGTPGAELAFQSYSNQVKQAWGGYYRLGTIFVQLIGRPEIMHLCVTYGLPRRRLMQLVHKLLAHLTDEPAADLNDRVITLLSRMAPST
ncbi:geranylgeranyl reductase family protein [Brooklawnia sp.]|uniref:NAD(P)/FAD-dependent oxidoreductase n=1 Tax=Brooklawnia sp. TaxID=2699740 RepID=UPI0031205482